MGWEAHNLVKGKSVLLMLATESSFASVSSALQKKLKGVVVLRKKQVEKVALVQAGSPWQALC